MKKIVVALIITLTLLLAGNWQSVFADLKGIETTLTPNNQRDKFQTDLFTGSATYSYPISMPKGTNDLTPDVSLSYSSLGAHDGNYLAGNGWELNRDYIERDINYSPSNLSDDKFVLHFKGGAYDLVYSPADGTYHTKTETFAKIEKIVIPVATPTPTYTPVQIVTASTFSGPYQDKSSGCDPQCRYQPFDTTNDLAYQGNGYAQPSVTFDVIPGYPTIHNSAFLNDGSYGNGASWISNSANSWVKIDLGRVVSIDTVQFGRDRTNNFDDRDPGQFQIQVATADNIYANGDASNDSNEYTQVYDSTPTGYSGLVNYNQTIRAQFAPVQARYIKVIVQNAGADIDELEVFSLLGIPSPTPTPTQSDILANFKGEYFNNTGWNGTPTLVRNDPEINFNWGNGSPDPSIQSDNFSVRWTKTVYLTGGSYTYSLHSDDSMQLLIDGTQVASSDPGSIGDTTTTVNLTTGNHTFQLLYIEWGGTAYAKFNPLHDGTYWRLTTKDGTQYEFGKSADSQLPCSTNTYTERWNIDQVTDTHNNAIYYTYTQDNAEIQGTSYLAKIQYNNDKSRSIVFNYQSNPYQRKQYIQGCLVTQPSNLQSIQVNDQNSLVHEYDLSYTQTTSNQPLLQSITEKGNDGSSLPPTTFNYKPQVNTWTTQQSLWLNHASVDANLDKTDVFMYDVNGDGLVDILKTTRDNGNDTWAVLLNQGNSWSTNYQMWVDHQPINANLDPFYQTNVVLADVTGDGLPDIVRSGSPWQVLRNTGTSWNTTWETWSNVPADLSDTKTKLIDVNGDGLADVVKSINNGNGTYTWQVFKNLGNNSWDTNGEYWVNSQAISADLSMTNVALSDVNGDGLPDIVRTTYNGDQYAINTPVTWYVYINTGSSWNTNAEIWVNNLPLGSHLQNPNSTISDVNGDGLPDIVRSIDYGTNDEWDALLNKGNSWDSAYTVFINPATQSLDLDAHNSNVRIVDVNGDGLPDLIKGSADCSCNEDTWMVWLNLGTSPDLLSSVHTPQGATVSFDYTPSTSFNNKGSDNVPDLGFPIWAVTKMTTDNGVSGSAHTNQSTTYSYANGLYSWLDKEFRGFGNVTENLPNGGQKQYVFNQDNALKGQLASEITSIYNGAPYEKSEYTWTSSQTGGYYVPLLRSEKHYTFDGVSTNPKTTETDYQYDVYGNIVKKSDLGDISTNGDERYTYIDYVYNPSAWIVNKPSHTHKNGSDDTTKIAEQWDFYDNDPNSTPSAQPSPTPTPGPFGDGSDGDITISSTTTESPIDSSVTAVVGATTATVNAGVGFVPNQVVLLYQVQGGNTGLWEFARVQSYSGSTLTFTAPINNSYTTSGNNHAEIRVVPQYHNVTIAAGANWNAKSWNGTTGGIIAFLANGTVSGGGNIVADFAGFRGGSGVGSSSNGIQGESQLGPGATNTAANGISGGGGSSGNAAGGGGGYATAGTTGNRQGGTAGVGGGVGGSADLATMFFGGAGGSGCNNQPNGGSSGPGGNGGGVIFAQAANYSLTGNTVARGATGGSVTGGDGSAGGGGGGAGGSILIRAQTATLGTSLLLANGNSGGNTGPGGAGGDGRIHIDYISSLTGTTNPALTTAQVQSFSLPPFVQSTQTITPIVTKGDVTTEIKWRNIGGQNIVTNYTYDQFGNQTAVTDGNNHTTSFVYGLTDTTNTYPEKVVNAKNQATNYSYNLGTGNLLSKTDPNGYVTSYTYDGFGRPLSEIDPYDSSSFPTVTYQYFDSSTPQGKLMSKRTTAGSTNTYNAYTFTDGFGRTIQTRSDAEDPTKQIVTDIFYDPMGLVSSQTIPHLSTSYQSYAESGVGFPVVSSSYDILGRLVVFTNADLTQKRTVYDHWTKTLIDENSHKTSQVSDAYGKIVEVDEPSANGTGLPYSTYYQYDPNDQLTKIIDNSGNNTTFTYDSLGNKITQLDPDLGTWNYTYDTVGNLINQTDNRSITTVRTYDELNRLTEIHYPNDPDVLYSYDTNTIGTLANKTDHAGTVSYAYDQRLRKTSETRIADGNSWTTGYAYDSADRLTSQTNPDGEIITYTYNPQGKIQSVGGVVTNIDYNAQGNVTGKTAVNGLTTTYTYDTKSFRLNKIQTGTLQNISYTYDNVGNVTSTKDNTTNITQTFAYDFLNRLTNAAASDNSYSQAYVYDPIGNLIQFTNALNTVSYAYGQQAGVHALTSAGDAIPVSPTPSPTPTPTPPATTFGTGADGDITVASGQTAYTDNIRSGIATSVGAGQSVIQLNSSLGFLVGQEVFILQVQGTGAGTYEFAQVSGVTGNSISLQNILSHSYLAGNNATSEVIVVPQYHDVTVQNGGTLTAHGWDGTSGGVSVFKATGTVQVDANGKIDVSSLGFRGGAGVNPNGRPGITQNQGESYMGIGIQSSDANLTAGGGGINDGGNRSGGGGGGGYATAGQVGTATGGSNPVSAPGNGGQTVGVDTLTSALFGGAGGAGAVYGTNTGNNGANGGGILFVTANTLSLNGGILANGGSGIASDGTHAGSGAGAGGSILIKAQNATLGSSNISAIGGLGGSGNGLAGAGGNGGAGRIRIEYYTSLSGSTSPSASVYQYGTTSEGTNQTVTTFGNGQDGDITISSDTREAPIDSSVAATSGTISITVGSSLGFASGQAVMFHQSQGVNVGTWELAKVQSYSGTTLTLTTPLVHSYSNTNGNQAQVRVVPQYHNVVVANGASWKPKLWNRNTGGILAFLANGTVTINGTIDARSAGFAGGLGSVGDNTTGVQGDSATGIGTSSTLNNGSGGGAAKKTFGSEASASGGGGNGTSGSNGTTFSGSTGGTGGSTAGSSDLSSMVFGGGSGGAGSIPSPALNGVAGGGIVMMNAANLVVNGNINLNGTTGIGSGNVDQGVTGGSAGGSYFLKAQSATIGSNAVTAVGGTGGINTGGSAQVGGNGGDGRIRIVYGVLSGTTTPAASTLHDVSLLNPPTALLSTSPSSGFSPLAVTLDASGSTAGTATISSYTFDFGDGSTPVTQSTPTIIHTYTTPGTYNATVTVTDAASLTATASQTITANASYTISGNIFTDLNTNGTQETGETGYQGATITLSGAGSRTATSDASGNYSFPSLAAGNYTVTLTLPSGYTATSANPIAVTLAANATANFGIVPICGGLIVTSALNLDASTITTGSIIHGSITYKNPCVTSYTANAIIIAARDGGNGNEDFQPYSGTVTLSAGQSITINTSKTIPTAGPIGQWYAFGSYEDTNNNWHGDSNSVNFTVVAPPISTVSDNWSSGVINSSTWNNWGSPQTSVVSNQLKISSVLGSNYYGLDSYNGNGQNMIGSSVTDQLVNAGNQALTSWEVYPIVILKNDDVNNYKLLFLVSSNTVIARKYVAGTYTDVRSVAYNANTYKFFRIREASGTTYWDTSADGATWTNFTSIADPFDESVVRAGMLAGTWQTEATTTSAIFDNFNVAFTLPIGRLLVSPTSGNVPTLVTADASSSTVGTDTIASYTFDFGDGTVIGPQLGSNATHTYTAGGNYTVTVTVKDTENNTATTSQSITLNTPPTANANGPYTFTEGSTGILTGSAADADNDPLTYAWDLNNDGIYDVTGISTPYSAVDGPATQTVVFKACDTHNACTTNSAIVTTTNATPVVGTISVSPTTVQTGTTATSSAPFTDAGTLDTHTATVNFGDGSGAQNATVSETNGSGTITKSHVYTTAGTYTITVSVTDNNSGIGTNTKQLTVNVVPTPTPTPSSGIQLDGTIRTVHNSGGNITLSSFSVNGSNANRFLLVAVGSHQGGGTNGASSVKYGGVSMNRLASKVGSYGEFVQIWGLKLPAGGTANIVTSGISGGDFTFIAAYSLYNVKQTYAVSFGTKSQSSNSSSISILPFSANNWIIDAIEAEPVPSVSGSNVQDWLQDGAPNSYDNGNGSRIIQSGGPTAVNMSWNLSYGARSNQAAVALEPF